MTVVTTVSHATQAPQRFVEKAVSYQLDALGPDPELKKILPLMFTSLENDIDHEEPDDIEIFAPVFVDKTNGNIRKSVRSDQISPISPKEMKGISTYFSGRHPGIDYRANTGTSIRAVLPGVVNEVGYERGGYGRYVILVHTVDGKTIFSLYAHMKITSVVQGQLIDKGDIVGEVGMTGHTTGPHLHFELHDNTRALNPTTFFAGNNISMKTKPFTL